MNFPSDRFLIKITQFTGTERKAVFQKADC